MVRYCITDSIETVAKAVAQNLDMIQVRAKTLSGRGLTQLVRAAVELAGPRVLVNTRSDVAIACGAGGVHLPGESVPPSQIRRIAPGEWKIGVSCHTVDELRRAEEEGADFAVFGPVFATGGKRPIGLEAFAAGARAVRMPVYALGGITEANAPDCLAAGASGLAGISLFK